MNAPALALDTVQVEVAFYDDAEMRKLLVYRTAAITQARVEKPLEVPKAEFLIYYLFHRIKLGTVGYRDYNSVARKAHLWLSPSGSALSTTKGAFARRKEQRSNSPKFPNMSARPSACP